MKKLIEWQQQDPNLRQFSVSVWKTYSQITLTIGTRSFNFYGQPHELNDISFFIYALDQVADLYETRLP